MGARWQLAGVLVRARRCAASGVPLEVRELLVRFTRSKTVHPLTCARSPRGEQGKGVVEIDARLADRSVRRSSRALAVLLAV